MWIRTSTYEFWGEHNHWVCNRQPLEWTLVNWSWIIFIPASCPCSFCCWVVHCTQWAKVWFTSTLVHFSCFELFILGLGIRKKYWSGFSREREPKGCVCVCECVCVYIYKTFYEELACTIMEDNKSQDLQWASWRPRRADGVIPVQRLAGLNPRKSYDSVWVQRQEKTNVPPRGQAGRRNSLLFGGGSAFSFYSGH